MGLDWVPDVLHQLEAFIQRLELPDGAVKLQVGYDKLENCSEQPWSILADHIKGLQEVEGRLKENCITNDKERDEKPQLLVPKEEEEEEEEEEEDVKESVKEAEVDSKFVQINAGKAEIEQRILAFIQRKQMEVDENNIREFCSIADLGKEGSCARTDAAFTPHPGCRSHIKVSRVVNMYGPQSRQRLPIKTEIATGGCGNSAIEERLQNLEVHLQLKPGRPVPLDIYERLKMLEKRVLDLEGTSPEYIHPLFSQRKRSKTQEFSQAHSLSEINKKIRCLQNALMKKQLDSMKDDQ
uniref:MAP3K12-binding inhibitory protein 1 isoform X2 n=1 Tax=Myxine glutinosa TaxID=7769 RepID=UPI00358F63E7